MTSSHRSRRGRPVPTSGPTGTPGASIRTYFDRFGLTVELGVAQSWFVTWVSNHLRGDESYAINEPIGVAFGLASHLGVPYQPVTSLERMIDQTDQAPPQYVRYLPTDFGMMLAAVEFLHLALGHSSSAMRGRFDEMILTGVANAPVDINVRFEAGRFYPSGAPVLDEGLVRDVLGNLRDLGHPTAAAAFEGALRAFTTAAEDQVKLKAVVRGLQESVESIAKAVTGRDGDLAANRELLGARAHLSPAAQGLLQPYITFTNSYRHAEPLAGQPPLTRRRVEETIYETGLLLRLISHGATKGDSADAVTATSDVSEDVQ